MEISKVLEKDIYELQDKIEAALDYCLELHKRHGDQPGWDLVEDELSGAICWAATPLEPIPEELQDTQEEEAFSRFLDDNAKAFSQAASTLIAVAVQDSYAYCVGRKYDYDLKEYDEAMERMRLAAAELTDSDQEILSKLCRVASAAAASIDPNDETPAGNKVCMGDYHWYYKSVSGMVEQVLQEKYIAEIQRKAAQR